MHLITILLLACGGATPDAATTTTPAADAAPPAAGAALAADAAPAKSGGPTFFSTPEAVEGRIAPMCGKEDEIAFNCDLQGGGSISLCASKPAGQWLQLRAGAPEAPKLGVPSVASSSIASFTQRTEEDDVGSTWELIVSEGGRTTTLTVRNGEDDNGMMAPIVMTVHDVAADGTSAGYECDTGHGLMMNQSLIDELVKKAG